MSTRFQVIKGGGGEALGMGLADYIWLDEEGKLCFKKKTILVGKDEKGGHVPLVQRWSFAGEHEVFILSPSFFLPDPTRPQPNYLVLCEVKDVADQCIPSNNRSTLRKALAARGPAAKLVWFGFEQPYWLRSADDSPNQAARKFLTAERHLGACFDAGLQIHSARNPIDKDIWDFKVGYRGFPQDLDPDPPSALTVADHLMVAQYLMEKIGAENGLIPRRHPLSVFISTAALREPGDPRTETAFLLKALKGHTLRILPHPINGGVQCIEVSGTGIMDPYKLALDVLEAVWPLKTDGTEPPEEDEEE